MDLDEMLADINVIMSAVADDLNAHEFHRHMQSDDPLGMVLRAHLFIEREITIILRHLLPEPSQVDWDRWRYATRVDLVAALEVFDRHMIQAYRSVGRLRNKVAHNLDQEIDEAKQAEFLNTLDAEFREAVIAGTEGEPFPEPLRLALTMIVMQLAAHRHTMHLTAVAFRELA
jgi:hypothetical protein